MRFTELIGSCAPGKRGKLRDILFTWKSYVQIMLFHLFPWIHVFYFS